MNKYICIHGHFYQPPRENPWLEEVELQESAQPYHDWNEKITAQCYAPNATSRILDSEKRIINIVNNYKKISFNFGPTLLSWLERHSSDVYHGILEADLESQKIFSGHGSAIAQGYNHMIMPLANARDQRTQVIWGIKDFEYRFKRKPEGMWLPETAVDIATLEVLAQEGIRFTILTPYQAKRVRKIGDPQCIDIANGGINPQVVYLCQLPSGRTMNLFFYDGPVSHDVAFTGLLNDGRAFAERLSGVFPKETEDQPRLAHIATDGETYGHHHRYGDMALAYCLYHIESNDLAKVTIYGEFLEKNPPTHEVEIVEGSSWSCSHGVERWRSDCGCCVGSQPGWRQEWRKPLREALDGLRDTLIPVYEEKLKEFTDDPWSLRDQYIQVILNRSSENVEKFFAENIHKSLTSDEKTRILKLLELQRHAMLMYTSCGWFFDEITGIETTQILQYAARVIQLAQEAAEVQCESYFLKILEQAPSNLTRFKNGAEYYEKYIKPASIDLLRVGAHYAMSSLFEGYPQKTNIYCYSVENEVYDLREAGKQKLVLGRARIRCDITWEEMTINFIVLHLGDHNLNAGVRDGMEENTFRVMQDKIAASFLRSDIAGVMRLMNDYFGARNHSLWHLFRHEQKKISEQMLCSAMEDIESHSRQIYEDYYPFIQASHDLGIALPKALSATVEFVLNRDLLELLQKDPLDLKKLQKIIGEVNRWSFQRDRITLGFVTSRKINQLMAMLLEKPEDLHLLQTIETLLSLVTPLFLDLDLWKAQNIYFQLCQKYYKEKQQKIDGEDDKTKKWLKLVERLGHFLDVKN